MSTGNLKLRFSLSGVQICNQKDRADGPDAYCLGS